MAHAEGTPFSSAALHEKTVQAIARGEIDRQADPRAYGRRTTRCTTIRNTRVLPEIMVKALALAEGDASRISIISEYEVVVLNHKRS